MTKNVAEHLFGQVDLDYIESHCQPIHPVLATMETDAAPERVPILDRESGRVLAALAGNRHRIVEVGTAIGYSTLWMALSQAPGGTITTIDPDQARTERARGYWRQAGVADEKVTIVNRPALEAFGANDPALAGPFDLAFIDALKHEYLGYLEAVIPHLASGALVVADNVLWSGRVSGARPEDRSRETEALRAFNRAALRDPRFTSTILPVGDGLFLATLRR